MTTAHELTVPSAWNSVDPLGEALHFLRMNGVFYCRSDFSDPFGLALPPMQDYLLFHFVTAGHCWIQVEGVEDRLLLPGALALVPHGRGHMLVSRPGQPAEKLFDLDREQVSERYEIARVGGGGPPSNVICGAVRFDHPAARQLVSLLPRLIVIEALDTPRSEWIQSTLQFMAAEAREMRPGGETVITRLADILVIQAIRTWLEKDPAARSGWLGALQDRQIGRAIALIHQDPGREWTVASLAGAVAMSRSAFSARFSELVGEAPMHYVTRWRMYVAMTELQEGSPSVGEVGLALGYQSEAAFNRAFRRFTGRSPGSIRRAQKIAG